MDEIRERLEKLYCSFDFKKAIMNDPIRFPKRFNNPMDIEITGLIASSFAYGSIRCFCKFLEELFIVMGKKPSDFIKNFKPSSLLKKLKIKYRFSTIHDIVAFLFIIQKLIEQSPSESLKYYFNAQNIVDAIFNYTQSALSVDLSPIYGKNIKRQGLLHFFPNPQKGSPCKRINLFLRWMVRRRDVDFGLWTDIKANELIIPLDIHIWRVSKKLGFTKRNSISLKTALEITDYLRRIDPEDPLKYDFVLCHGHINSLL